MACRVIPSLRIITMCSMRAGQVLHRGPAGGCAASAGGGQTLSRLVGDPPALPLPHGNERARGEPALSRSGVEPQVDRHEPPVTLLDPFDDPAQVGRRAAQSLELGNHETGGLASAMRSRA